MWSYFHGRRRQIGLVALGMACAVASLWVRAYEFEDEISFNDKHGLFSHIVFFSRSGIIWERETGDFPFTSNPVTTWFVRDASSTHVLDRDDPVEFLYRWQWIGFEIGEYRRLNFFAAQIDYWSISYGVIVLPLVGLAAWCLLTKPLTKPATNQTADHQRSPR